MSNTPDEFRTHGDHSAVNDEAPLPPRATSTATTQQTAVSFLEAFDAAEEDGGNHLWKVVRECADDLRQALAAHPEAPFDPDNYVLPCDVKLPLAMTICAGCKLSTLLLALSAEGRPRNFDPPAAATPLQQSGLGEGRRSSSDVERDYEALVYRRCETIGLDDLEGGCCPTCRARGRLATPVPVDAGGAEQVLNRVRASRSCDVLSGNTVSIGCALEAMRQFAALASPPVAGDREAATGREQAVSRAVDHALRQALIDSTEVLEMLDPVGNDLDASIEAQIAANKSLTDPQAAAKEPE